ncbi:uncharacterized protein SCHCODRAFT_01187442 [Schizophyllum commune H4-8]|nr:uncharacterized protein SCHCODRAFT_01187442 [Schizophyllum commune H4-8]KAI5899469.1 hypothetical protein SCHCODRAFT_01187442 [Schizophyllum commune H4-8]
MAILELFATSGFDEAANLEAAKDALNGIGERLALVYAGEQIENPAYVHWALQWTSLAGRDSSVQDGTYKRLLNAAGSTLLRDPVVVTLKANQRDTLASILRTPVPEFAATRMKSVAERAEARQTLDELLAGAHERATQGELALTAVDDEDVIVYVVGWNSLDDYKAERVKPSQKAKAEEALTRMEPGYKSHCWPARSLLWPEREWYACFAPDLNAGEQA